MAVTPTLAEPSLDRCLRSVQEQSYRHVRHLVAIDGPQHREPAESVIERYRDGDREVLTLVLPENTGAGGFWGHRIYAASALLANADVIVNLDCDNWYDADHVARCVANMSRHGTDWTYSLRRVWPADGSPPIEDDGDSLGAWPRYGTLLSRTVLSEAENRFNDSYPHLVDTSCYAMRTPLYVQTAPLWYAGHGADCVVATWLVRHHAVATTGRATVNYPLTSRTSAPPEWFIDGNRLMRERYGDALPWRSPALRASLGPLSHPRRSAEAWSE